jgi:DNA invertase Pin-like site-specific DNA recombinase
MIHCAIYARVSTSDQHCELQLTELRRYAAARGWEIHGEYVDHGISGSKASRPALDRMMKDARERRIDCIIVWKLDRIGRSLKNFVAIAQELESLDVRLIAVTQGIDTDKQSPTGRLLMHILGAVAEFERSLIQERVVAGISVARSQGKTLGRPRRVFRRDEAREMRAAGVSWAEISQQLGVPVGTVREACR